MENCWTVEGILWEREAMLLVWVFFSSWGIYMIKGLSQISWLISTYGCFQGSLFEFYLRLFKFHISSTLELYFYIGANKNHVKEILEILSKIL